MAPGYDTDSDAFLLYLCHLLKHTKARVLIPSSDGTVSWLRLHREVLQRQIHIALAEEEALALAVNKEQTLALARQLGVHVPRTILVHAPNEIEAALNEIGLPAVLKPVETWVWQPVKQSGGTRLLCHLVTNLAEAHAAVEALSQAGSAVMVQPFLPGRREAVSLLYAHGQIYARFAQYAKRTQPPLGGTSVLRQSIAVPSYIGAQAERLVREMNLE